MPARSSKRVLLRLRGTTQFGGVDRDARAVADDRLTGDEHVADRTSVGAPHQLQADVATWRPAPVGGVVDDDVGLLADFQRTDPVGHADGFGTGDRRQLEHLMGAEPLRIEPAVAGQTGGERGGAQDVGDVAGVGCVAAEGDAAAALDDVGVAADAGDALTEPQVRPRAVGDRRACRQHEVDLFVVEPHAVGQQQVRPEHAEVVQVGDRSLAGAGEVALGVGRGRRQVHRHAGAHRAGEVGGAGQQLVAGQVVADEGDPALDEAARRERLRRRPADGRAPRRPCR